MYTTSCQISTKSCPFRSCPGLQHQLVRELIHRGEQHEAARWAAAYSVPLNTLPLNVQFILMNPTSRLPDDGGEREKEQSPTEYLHLPLSLDSVHFVNTTCTLRECQQRLAEVRGRSVCTVVTPADYVTGRGEQ